MADTPINVTRHLQSLTTFTSLYTVAANKILIIRHIRITSDAAETIFMRVGTSGAGAALHATDIFHDTAIPANSVYDWSGFLVAEATMQVYAKVGAGTGLAITISGVLVDV